MTDIRYLVIELVSGSSEARLISGCDAATFVGVAGEGPVPQNDSLQKGQAVVKALPGKKDKVVDRDRHILGE